MSSRTARFIAFAAVVLAAFQFGCTQSPPLAPGDTRAADEKAIRDSEIAWVQEFGAKDIDKIVSHYEDDASSFITDVPTAMGKDAIRAGLKEQLADPNFALNFQTAKVEVSKAGDIAYSQGTYTATVSDPKTKKPVTSKGNYVEVYKKQADGSWKIVEDIATDEAPPALAKPAKKA